jgi:glucokinase
MLLLVGVDIGGTKIGVCLGESDSLMEAPRILARETFPTDRVGGWKPNLERVVETVRRLGGNSIPDGAGVACGGPLDSRSGRILSPPNLPGWDDVPASAFLSEHLDCPVALRNDADACVLAEWRWGAARGASDAVFLTFGTGMGAGILLGGRLHPGSSGSAGEIGHIRLAEYGPVGYGKAGSFEGFCSGGGIAQLAAIRAREQLQSGNTVSWCPDESALGKADARVIAEAARAGDATARNVFQEVGTWLGRGIAILVDVLNPEVVILGSLYLRAQELLDPAMRDALGRECLPGSLGACRIVPAGLGEDLGLHSSLAAAMEAVR